MGVRIGIDYTAAVHQSAGIGRYTYQMVRALAAQSTDASGPQYRLFVAAGKRLQPQLPGPNFSWCPAGLTERWLARLWYRLRLPLWIESWTGPLDLFHAADFFLPPVRPGTRTIVTIHDLSFVREPDSVMPGMQRQLNQQAPRSVARADHVVAVSAATRQDLIELYQTPPKKISVLYHGVTAEFQPVKDPLRLSAVRQKYGLRDRPFVLSVGTLQPRKNFRRLIEAFAGVDQAYALVIAGSTGWGYQEIFDEIKKLGLEQRVHLPGFVADADLPALYSAATLFIYPSLYEGFGLPLLEAMACGTPVIASNRSALPEVVGQAGLLVDPFDIEAITGALSTVLADEALQQRLSEAGRHQAARFTWDKMAAELVKLYQKVIEA
jgi:glycosyltransferase involved in cell wall biosynthesis